MAQSRLMRRTTVLPLVKAYPNLSRKYREVACVAGIDLQNTELVRIYPIPFRFLDEQLQFKKYQPIEVELGKRREDKRPESWGVSLDSLKVIGDLIDTRDGWEARRQLVKPFVDGSMCELQAGTGPDRQSLAIIRPKQVTGLRIEEIEIDLEKKQFAEVLAGSPTLFEDEDDRARQRQALEQIPFSFKYEFRCEHPRCKGHSQSIIDWEIGELFRKVKDRENWQELVRGKWVDELCGETRDTAFIVGNHNRYRGTFMVLGVWWPPSVPRLKLFYGLRGVGSRLRSWSR